MFSISKFIPFALLSEFLAPFYSKRIPEPNISMDTDEQVQDFLEVSEGRGGIVVPHLFSLLLGGTLINKGDVIVDLGTGSGAHLVDFALSFPEANFIGIEFSENMADVARAKIKSLGLKNISIIRGDMRNIEQLINQKVDVVFSCFALHHLPGFQDVEEVFYGISKILKKDGKLFLFDLARLRSEVMKDYIVSQTEKHEPEIYRKDFRNSMSAAFRVRDMKSLYEKYFQSSAEFERFSPFPLYFWIRTPHSYEIVSGSSFEKKLTSKVRSFEQYQKILFKRLLKGFRLPKSCQDYMSRLD